MCGKGYKKGVCGFGCWGGCLYCSVENEGAEGNIGGGEKVPYGLWGNHVTMSLLRHYNGRCKRRNGVSLLQNVISYNDSHQTYKLN